MKRGPLAAGLVALAASGLPGCGGAATGVATNPPPGEGTASASASASSGGTQSSGARTVLSPIGINIRGADDRSSTQVGTAAQGSLLTVIDHSDRNGGWYKVRGQTTTGWITADPDLTAPGHFSPYSVETPQFTFSALYADGWTFANEPGDVLFKPQSGPEAIVVRPAPSFAGLGPAGREGYSASTQTQEVVCGVTGTLVGYDRQGGAVSSAPPGAAAASAPPAVAAPPLAHFAQLRLHLDPAHAMELDYNYDAPERLQTFRDFFNSLSFPFPQCQGPATPPAAAAPPPGAPPAGSIP